MNVKITDVDRRLISMIEHVSKEERDALLNMLDLTKAEPTIKLSLAIFRDVYMFKDMAQALLMRYQGKIRELESRIEELETHR